jgi:hypothetical protein
MKRLLTSAGVCLDIVFLGGVATMGIVFARHSPRVELSPIPKVTNVEIVELQKTTVHDTFTVTGSLEPWKEVEGLTN